MRFKHLLKENNARDRFFYLDKTFRNYIYHYNHIDEIEEKFFDGEDATDEINKVREDFQEYIDLGNQLIQEEDSSFINVVRFKKIVQVFKPVCDAYETNNKAIQSILNVVKKGEPVKSAVKKISKMTKTVEEYDIETLKKRKFFDEYSEEDILDQIEKHDGIVELYGAIDTYIKFEDGKVVDIYY